MHSASSLAFYSHSQSSKEAEESPEGVDARGVGEAELRLSVMVNIRGNRGTLYPPKGKASYATESALLQKHNTRRPPYCRCGARHISKCRVATFGSVGYRPLFGSLWCSLSSPNLEGAADGWGGNKHSWNGRYSTKASAPPRHT